jgi:hypothetical protein
MDELHRGQESDEMAFTHVRLSMRQPARYKGYVRSGLKVEQKSSLNLS